MQNDLELNASLKYSSWLKCSFPRYCDAQIIFLDIRFQFIVYVDTVFDIFTCFII